MASKICPKCNHSIDSSETICPYCFSMVSDTWNPGDSGDKPGPGPKNLGWLRWIYRGIFIAVIIFGIVFRIVLAVKG